MSEVIFVKINVKKLAFALLMLVVIIIAVVVVTNTFRQETGGTMVNGIKYTFTANTTCCKEG